MKQWEGFKGDKWRTSVDTRDFIQKQLHRVQRRRQFLRTNRSKH